MKKLARGLFAGAAAAAALTLAAGPVSAHHSTAMFHWDQEETLSGTIESFEYTNPHSWIWFLVPDASGKPVRYGIEGMSPNGLTRNGWTKNTLKPGDHVKMVIHPLKDTTNHGGFCVSVTFEDGKTMRQLGAA